MSVGVADRLGRIELRGDPSSLGVPRAVRDKLAALMTGCVQRDLERFFIDLLGGEATCSEGFVMCFLKVPLACLGSMAAAVQPNSLGNSQKSKQNLWNKCTPPRYQIICTKAKMFT